jgi:hypothetical protein
VYTQIAFVGQDGSVMVVAEYSEGQSEIKKYQFADPAQAEQCSHVFRAALASGAQAGVMVNVGLNGDVWHDSCAMIGRGVSGDDITKYYSVLLGL